jgi:Family of unknown function (DUF6522)
MAEVKVMADGFVIDAGLVGAAFGIDAASVQSRMRTGEITSRCETGIDEDAGRFRLTLFCGGRALRLTVDADGNILSRSTFPAPSGAGQTGRADRTGTAKGV